VIDLDSNLSVNPTKWAFKPSNRLPMPSQIQAIPSRTKVLGADATPDLNTSMSLFN